MIIDGDAIDAFDEAKEDGDKMSELMYEQYFMMEDYLKSNSKLEVAAHVMLGGIFESLYISAAQLIDVDLTDETVNLLYGQKQAVSDLIEVYQDMEGDEIIIDELIKVKKIFETASSDFTKGDLETLHEIVKAFHDEFTS